MKHLLENKYFKNTSWLFLEKIVRAVLNITVGVYVARYLGPGKFGLLSYAQSLVMLVSVFSALGMDNILVRELVNEKSQEKHLMGSAFFLRFMGALFSMLVLWLVLAISEKSAYEIFIVMVVNIGLLAQSFFVVDFYFQSQVKSKYVAFSYLTTVVLSSLIKLILIWIGADLTSFVILFCVESFLVAGFLIFFYFRSGKNPFRWKVDYDSITYLLKHSWPLIFSGITVMLYHKIDQVMIKEMLDNIEIGKYAAAVKISEATHFIPIVLTSSLFPAIVRGKEMGEQVFKERLQALYTLMFILALLISIPVLIFSDWGMQFLYGQQYEGAGDILSIHIWSTVFIFIGVANSRWFIVNNLQKYLLWLGVVGCCINIVLNYLLIPKWGGVGAAWTTLVSQFISAYAGIFVFKECRENFYLASKAFVFKEWSYAFKMLKKSDY